MRKNELAHNLFDPLILDDLIKRWNEPHRFYHNYYNHLIPILSRINDDMNLTPLDKNILEIVAYFHDSIYDPRSKTNEEDSVQLFLKSIICADTSKYVQYINLISSIILETKSMNPTTSISEIFLKYDLWTLNNGSVLDLITDNYLIFKEFQHYDFNDFKVGRFNFLKNLTIKNASIVESIKYLEKWRPNIGIYAGSFYPLHKGHLNIIEKAEKIFDKVIIVQAQNPDKEAKTNEHDNISNILKYHEISYLAEDNFITDFMKNQERNCNTTLIRGLRNGYDFAYELNQFRFLQDRCPNVKTVFIPCDREYDYIASSAIRSLEKIQKGSGQRYL